jgi:hypothetical protein
MGMEGGNLEDCRPSRFHAAMATGKAEAVISHYKKEP